MRNLVILFAVTLVFAGCSKKIYLGADLSYINEIEECGAYFKNDGVKVEPFKLFAKKGTNLVRVRLWHSPKTPYSNFNDVKKTIRRAKAENMKVLLDFHYSDTWADPGRQDIPLAWAEIKDVNVLADSIYNYTSLTLSKLQKENLLPEMVQVGNETNSEVMQPAGKPKDNIDWQRNSLLLNRGIQAVRDISAQSGKKIEIMLHVAQPENALRWFAEAKVNKVTDYDYIGISYYPLWSEIKFDKLPKAIDSLVTTYKKELLIVETAYPFTMQNVDKANNILDEKALIDGYPATPKGQRDYMIELTRITLSSGGKGVVYWEPAWVTSSCKTLWGDGSHWDNATFFDSANDNEALPAFDFYNKKNYKK